jgi:hypothetical protein
MNERAQDNSRLWELLLLLNVVGFLILVATVAYGLHVGVGTISTMVGVFALLGSIANGNKKLIVSSAVLAAGFTVAFFVVWVTQVPGQIPIEPVNEQIVAPRNMMAMPYPGRVEYERAHRSTMLIYFSNEGCDDADFIKAIDNVLSRQDSFMVYQPGLQPDDAQTYYDVKGNPLFYYDTAKMPAEEVERLMASFGVGQAPCLVRIDGRIVADVVTEADEAEITDLFYLRESMP